MAMLAKRIKENPDDSLSKFTLALEFIKAGDISKAQALFEHLQHHDPEYVGTYYHLGSVYEQVGNLQLAQATYKKGIEIAKQQHNTHTASELTAALQVLQLHLEDEHD